MRRIRDVLRLKFEAGLSDRILAAAVGISKGAVAAYVLSGPGGWAVLAAAGGAGRHGAGAAAVPGPAGAGGGQPGGAGLGWRWSASCGGAA